MNEKYSFAVDFDDVRAGRKVKVADYVTEPRELGEPLFYTKCEPIKTELWMSSADMSKFIRANGGDMDAFNLYVSPNHPMCKLGDRKYLVGKVELNFEDDGIWAEVVSLLPQWDELRIVHKGKCRIGLHPMVDVTRAGGMRYVVGIHGIEVVYRDFDLSELIGRIRDRNDMLAQQKDLRNDNLFKRTLQVELEETGGNPARDQEHRVVDVKADVGDGMVNAVDYFYKAVPLPSGELGETGTTKIHAREIKPMQYRGIDKYHYGRVSLLGHVRLDAVRVDTGAPGRHAYMGSKDAIVRAVVDYRGAKLYIFNSDDRISDVDFLECVKMAGLERIKDIEVWNNLSGMMVNDRLIFDGVRKSVKLHHEVEMDIFSGRFTKNWFDTNYKEIYGFHSESIDRGAVRELRRVHGTRKAEPREGAGYNGPHS